MSAQGKRKCDEPLCTREAQIFISRRDKNKKEHLYCSVFCAQQDSSRRESGTTSAKTEKFSSEELGETSPDISSFGSMIKKEAETPSEPLTLGEMRRLGMIEIRESTLNKPNEEEKSTSNESEQETEIAVLADSQENSIELSLITEPEELRHQSLIEDSIRSTHGLAKSVMAKVKNEKEVNPALVNAACNAVKQVHALLKLRYDIHREMRKK